MNTPPSFIDVQRMSSADIHARCDDMMRTAHRSLRLPPEAEMRAQVQFLSGMLESGEMRRLPDWTRARIRASLMLMLEALDEPAPAPSRRACVPLLRRILRRISL